MADLYRWQDCLIAPYGGVVVAVDGDGMITVSGSILSEEQARGMAKSLWAAVRHARKVKVKAGAVSHG